MSRIGRPLLETERVITGVGPTVAAVGAFNQSERRWGGQSKTIRQKRFLGTVAGGVGAALYRGFEGEDDELQQSIGSPDTSLTPDTGSTLIVGRDPNQPASPAPPKSNETATVVAVLVGIVIIAAIAARING